MPDPIRQALERLQQYAAAHPEHDTAELVAAARAALAAEPPAPDPREALAARPLLEAVARLGDCIGQHTVAEIATISDRAAAWLAENPPGQPVAIEPRGCPTPGACSCVEPPAPAPVADGEREELIDWLDSTGELAGGASIEEAKRYWRAAALLRQLPPEGLVAVEYFHIASSARIVGEASEKWGECWNVYNSRHVTPCTEFPTLANAWEALQQARRQEVGDE